MKKIYKSERNDQEKTTPWLKGVLERMCLNFGLLLGYPHILIAFGALKIGTKINNESINSEYYLLGNLASISTCFMFLYLIDSETIYDLLYGLLSCQ